MAYIVSSYICRSAKSHLIFPFITITKFTSICGFCGDGHGVGCHSALAFIEDEEKSPHQHGRQVPVALPTPFDLRQIKLCFLTICIQDVSTYDWFFAYVYACRKNIYLRKPKMSHKKCATDNVTGGCRVEWRLRK